MDAGTACTPGRGAGKAGLDSAWHPAWTQPAPVGSQKSGTLRFLRDVIRKETASPVSCRGDASVHQKEPVGNEKASPGGDSCAAPTGLAVSHPPCPFWGEKPQVIVSSAFKNASRGACRQQVRTAEKAV